MSEEWTHVLQETKPQSVDHPKSFHCFKGVPPAAPRNIPFGTGVFVPGYGCGTVSDRGGRKTIAGTYIDVWFSSEQQANNWGVKRHVPVEVCDDGH
jgi:3D domain